MSQRLICDLASLTKLLKDQDKMDRKKCIKPGNDKIVSANVAETSESDRMSKLSQGLAILIIVIKSCQILKILLRVEISSKYYNQNLIITKVDYQENVLSDIILQYGSRNKS